MSIHISGVFAAFLPQNRLQEMLGCGSRNLSEMFLIDGMFVDKYARQQKLDVWAADLNAEVNRRAILAAALLTGEHHVDMVRAGLMTGSKNLEVLHSVCGAAACKREQIRWHVRFHIRWRVRSHTLPDTQYAYAVLRRILPESRLSPPLCAW